MGTSMGALKTPSPMMTRDCSSLGCFQPGLCGSSPPRLSAELLLAALWDPQAHRNTQAPMPHFGAKGSSPPLQPPFFPCFQVCPLL